MSEGNEISRRYQGPGDNTPYVPSWLVDEHDWQELHDSIIGLIPEQFRQNSTGAASCVKKLVQAYEKTMQENHEFRHGHRHPQLLKVLQTAYLKHHMGRDDVGWNKLSDMMCDALCEAMGDAEFQRWVERQ